MVNVAHSIYVATHKQFYEYFPTDVNKVYVLTDRL